jgi:hypothetical protein
MRKEIILTVLIGLFIAVAAVSAQASLVPMSWGFPTFEATNTLTQTADSLATASDVESADIAFPTTVPALPSGLRSRPSPRLPTGTSL